MSSLFSKSCLVSLILASINIEASEVKKKKRVRPPIPKEYYQPNYIKPDGLVKGAQFQDLILPVPIQAKLEVNAWGTAEVLPRDLTNGIEDEVYSYWGGNIVQSQDGVNHLFCCRWPEDYRRGHFGYQSSEVVHAVSENGPLGPYKVVDVIGPGHNPEIYQAKDGSWLIGVLEDIGTYKAPSLNGPWKPHMPTFTPLHASKNVNLRNRSYAKCDDGSVLMVIKNGTIWHSSDGVKEFKQLTGGSVYFKPNHLPAKYEDPVIWKDEVQFHLIYNDCLRREAYYMRSPDGVNWHVDPGFAYTTDFMKYENGQLEKWYKWERVKVRLDEYGRATHLNFAAIDVSKKEDKGNDKHSSKNVVLPLSVSRRISLLESTKAGYIDIKINAESGFSPNDDLDLSSVNFGSPKMLILEKASNIIALEK